MLTELVYQLDQGVSLSPEQVTQAVSQLVEPDIPAQLKADLLTALARKGESTEEITCFARELRGKALQPPLSPAARAGEIIDVCGTGGDGLNTFNISTTVALVAASAGVAVAKHGNRAVTSHCGSADLLQALGIATELSPAQAAHWLDEYRFAFFFAPKYHPAFKQIAPARALCAQRHQRTIFNYLGPLLNPTQPTAQLIGVPRPDLCEPLARVLQSLGTRRAMVVCGRIPAETEPAEAQTEAFLDELSVLGETVIAEFYQERALAICSLSPSHFPFQPARLADLAGGDPTSNAEIVRRILEGEDRGPKRDAVLLNAAAALLIAGTAKTLVEGWDLAAELVDSGRASTKLAELVAASRHPQAH